MKRDMDLVRQILLAVEARPPQQSGRLRLEGTDDNAVSDHIELLHEVNFLEAYKTNDEFGWAWMPQRLTWHGHDFLDSVRDEGIWEKTKLKLLSVGGAAGLEVVRAIATDLAKRALGLSG